MLKAKQTSDGISTDVATYVEQEDIDGYTALLHAACEGNVQAVKSLLTAKANVLSADKEGWTPMHFAAANGYTAVINLLFQHNKKCLEQRDHEGRTPLQRACYYGRKEAVELLLLYQADIEAKDDKDKTPLHAAVSYARIFNKEVIKLLLNKGANLEAKTGYGWTPLHSASRYGNASTVKFLISLEANIEAKNTYGETPLNCIVSEEKMHYEDKEPIIIALLDGKADIHTQDTSGCTPLHWACIRGELTVASILLKHNARLDKEDKEAKTALHYAAKGNHSKIVELLIRTKKQLETQTADMPFFSAQTPIKAVEVPTSKTPAFFSSSLVISPNTSNTSNKSFSLQNLENSKPPDKFSSMEAEKFSKKSTSAVSAESNPTNDIGVLIQKQQTQINELCCFVKLQAVTIKEMEERQKKLQTEVERLTIEQENMHRKLNRLQIKPQEDVTPTTPFFRKGKN